MTLTVACLLVPHGLVYTEWCKKKENLLSGRFASRYVLLMKEQNAQTGLS